MPGVSAEGRAAVHARVSAEGRAALYLRAHLFALPHGASPCGDRDSFSCSSATTRARLGICGDKRHSSATTCACLTAPHHARSCYLLRRHPVETSFLGTPLLSSGDLSRVADARRAAVRAGVAERSQGAVAKVAADNLALMMQLKEAERRAEEAERARDEAQLAAEEQRGPWFDQVSSGVANE